MTDVPPEQQDSDPNDPIEMPDPDDGTNVDGDGDAPDGQPAPPSPTD